MTLSGILLGILNAVLLAVILVLVGAIIAWVVGALGWPVPWNIQRLYLAVVALIFLIYVVAVLFGAVPHWRIVGAPLLTLTG